VRRPKAHLFPWTLALCAAALALGCDALTDLAVSPTATPASPTPRPSSTPKPSATPRRPTSTPRPPTHTPVPASPTPSQELAWGSNVEVVAELDGDLVRWSPVAGELAYAVCDYLDPARDGVFLARGPAFEPRRISPSAAPCRFDDIGAFQLMWSPNGARLVFSDLALQPGEEFLTTRGIRLMDRSGGGLRAFDPEGRGMRLVGWMDGRSLVYLTYGGGGTWDGGVLDTSSGNVAAFLNRVSAAYPPNDRLIPIDQVYGFPAGRRPALALTRAGGEVPFLPSETFAGSGVTRFEDWFPDGRTMLVLTWEAGKALESDDPQTALEVWGTGTEQMTALVPGGIYGRLSPNGRLLAFFAPHALVVGSDGLVERVDRSLRGGKLYLMEIDTRRILFSTDGALPTESMLEQWGGERPVLLAWSPNGRRLVFFNTSLQWVSLDVATLQLRPITTNVGETLVEPQWSFDSQYLSLTRPPGRSSQSDVFLPGRTFVLIMP